MLPTFLAAGEAVAHSAFRRKKYDANGERESVMEIDLGKRLTFSDEARSTVPKTSASFHRTHNRHFER